MFEPRKVILHRIHDDVCVVHTAKHSQSGLYIPYAFSNEVILLNKDGTLTGSGKIYDWWKPLSGLENHEIPD